MDVWVLLLFFWAVPLTWSTAGAQTTTAAVTHITSTAVLTTDTTTNTPTPTTTSATPLPPTTTTTTAGQTTTATPIATTTTAGTLSTAPLPPTTTTNTLTTTTTSTAPLPPPTTTTTAGQTTTTSVLTSTSDIPTTTTTGQTTPTPVLTTTSNIPINTTGNQTTTTSLLSSTITILSTTTINQTTTTSVLTSTSDTPTTTTTEQTTPTPVLTTTSDIPTTATTNQTTTTSLLSSTITIPSTTTINQTTTTPVLTTTSNIPINTTANQTTTTSLLSSTITIPSTTTINQTTTTPVLTTTSNIPINTTANQTTTTSLLSSTITIPSTTTINQTTTTSVLTSTSDTPTTTTTEQTTPTPVLTTTSDIPINTTGNQTTTTSLLSSTITIPSTTTINQTTTTSVLTSTSDTPTTTTEQTTPTPVLTTTSDIPTTTTITTSSTTEFPNTTTNAPPPTTTTTPTTTMATTTTTTPPTTSNPPTTPPLVCLNGGVEVSGVCVCPDEWSGNTCSVANFCKADKLDEFPFPSTPVGWFAYSTEICPKGTSNAGKPQASTRCSTKNGSPSFDRPLQKLKCDQTLSDIQQNLTSAADLETLASSTQILTSRPEELTAENVTAAAQIVNTLLLSPNATESVRVAAVATVSQLLNASVPDNTEENDATVGLTLTLDQLSVNLSSSLNESQSQVVQPNLVVQSVKIPAVDTQGVQFTSLTGTSGSFVADRIQLNTNASTVVVENGFIADALIYIRFPYAATSRQQPSNVSLGFVLYQNNRFFRSRLYRSRRPSVRVLSASVRGQERSVVPQHVEMMFRPTVMNGTSLYDFACVFWNYSLEDWSTVGCSKGNASDGVLRCFCNHTTNFAALWSFRENYEYAEALGVISIIGLSISIVCLVVTIIYHIKEKIVKGDDLNSQITQLCIFVSLLAFILTFLFGVENSSRQDDDPVEVSQDNIIPKSDEHIDPDRGSCTAVAALLHFLLLATFMWNSLYGTLLLMLTKMDDGEVPSHWIPVSFAAGYGVPAVIMAITVAVTYSVDDPLEYRQEEFCWLAALDKSKNFDFLKPMFWGFVLPILLILIYNFALFALISINKSTNCCSSKKFLQGFSVAVILGLTWVVGYLVLFTTGVAHLVLSIFFCLLTTTQGVQIFFFITFKQLPSFRTAVARSAQYISSVSIPLHNLKYRLIRNWDRTRSEFYRAKKEEATSFM